MPTGRHTILLPMMLMLMLAGSCSGAETPWAKALFDKTSHDFGVVARGADVEHRFTIDNIYVEDVHIQEVYSSCGCTDPKVTKETLKTHETAELVARLDTRRFKGTKEATIHVVLDKPFQAEVLLKIYCFIRSDVVFQPGSVQFGAIREGSTSSQRVCVKYAGRRNWKVTDVIGPSFLQAKLREVSRDEEPGSQAWLVVYDLDVVLTEKARPGLFQEHLILRTNDVSGSTSQLPLTVEGSVIEALSVGPSPLFLGIVRPRQSVEKKLIVKADRPFRVIEVTVPDDRFKATMPVEAKRLQQVLVRFTATEAVGRITGKIGVKTDLPDAPRVEVPVISSVVAGAVAGSADEKGPPKPE